MKELNFKWRYKDYELRACPITLARLNENDENETIELVKWVKHEDGKEYCFSLAYWERNKEGYDLNSVGSRIFEYIEDEDIEEVWKQLKVAQKILDIFYDSCKE